MRHNFYYLLISLIFSCSTKNSKKVQQADNSIPEQPKIDTVAAFVDSTNIAISKQSKIFIAGVTVGDSIHKAYVRFYRKENNTWKVKYSFDDEHWSGQTLTAVCNH